MKTAGGTIKRVTAIGLAGMMTMLGTTLLTPGARAADKFWDNTGGTANDWDSVANWSIVEGGGATPSAIPGASDEVIFSATPIQGEAQTVNLNGSRSVQGVSVLPGVSADITLQGGNSNTNLLLLGASGITLNGSGALQVGNILLDGSQSWANNSTSDLHIGRHPGLFTMTGAGNPTLTNNGSGPGRMHVSSYVTLSSKVNKIVQNSSTSELWLRSDNWSFTGDIEIRKGTLVIGSSESNLGTGGTVHLGNAADGSDAATLLAFDAGNRTYSNAVTLASNTKGLLKIVLRDDTGTQTLTFTGGITGNNSVTLENRARDSDDDDTLVFSAGALNNAGTITHVGSGSGDLAIDALIGTNVTGVIQNSATSRMVLNGANAYGGDTIVSNGILAVNNGSAIPDAGKLAIHGGGQVSVTGGVETVGTLFFGGVQQAAGTWGSSASAADHTNDIYFTGAGVLSVATGPLAGEFTETFDTAATTATNGWTGSGNTAGSNNYGWYNTNVVLGAGTAGAAGGVFARTAGFSHFADTALDPLSRTNTFRLAGSFRLANASFDGQFYLGYFNPAQGSTNFVGIQINEPSGDAGNPFRGFAVLNGAGGAGSGVISLPQGQTLTFDLSWAGNADGSGTLSGILAGQSVSVTVAAGSGSFTAFGLLNGGMATSSAQKTAGCYFDSLTYIKNGYPLTTCAVTYDGNGNDSGSAPVDANSPYTANATVTVLGNTGNLAKAGYAFATWNTASNGSGTSHAPSNTFVIASNATFYAQWVPLPALVTETFDTAATTATNGWTGGGNTAGSNNYGWASTNAVLGGNSGGAAGGVFARSSNFSYFADTDIGAFDRTNTLRLAGSFMLTNANFDGQLYLGYFNPEQGSTNFIGIQINEPSGAAGNPFRGFAVVNGAGGAGSGVISLPQGQTLTFDLTWAGNADGSGTLSGTLAGTNVSVTVATGSGSFTAFGLLNGGMATSSAQKTAGCYFDTLTYNTQEQQTIVFGAIADQLIPQTLALAATASSSLPVVFAVKEGPALLSGTSLTFTVSGYVTVQAAQAGNARFQAAQPEERRFAVLTEEGILDADGNGVDDRWEKEHWPDGTPPATVMKRGTPMPLRDVFVADLDPFDPDSVLWITHFARLQANGTWRTEVAFAPTSVRRLYDLETAPQLTNGWQRLVSDIVPNSSSVRLDTPDPQHPLRFYRIKVRLPPPAE